MGFEEKAEDSKEDKAKKSTSVGSPLTVRDTLIWAFSLVFVARIMKDFACFVVLSAIFYLRMGSVLGLQHFW